MPPSENRLRPKIIIKNNAADTTLHEYDAFDPDASDIFVSSLNLDYTLYDAPQATFYIEDSGNTLDPAVINGCKVLISLGKTQGGLDQQFSGYIRGKQVFREATGTFDMEITALGSQVILNERVTNFSRMAKRTAVDSVNYDTTDTTNSISTVFSDLFTKTDHLPIGGPVLPFTTNGISTMSEVLPAIKSQYREVGAVANEICACNGSIFLVDADDDVVLRFPTSSSSGIRIVDTEPSASDIANTAYIVGPWVIRDSALKEDGFSNRLYGRGGTELYVDAFSSTDAASTSLHDRDLAIQFTPTETFNAEAFSVVVHKVGTPVPSNGKLQAVLRVDKSNSPGSPIASAYVPITKILTSPGGVVQLPFSQRSVGLRNLQVDKEHWLQLAIVGGDASNTIHWHRDTGTSGRNAYRTAGGAWTVQSGSYTFVYGQLQGRRVLTEASDGTSISTYGVVESMIDADWINDGRTMDKYLTAILQFTAKIKRIIDISAITIPDTLPQIGQTVELLDSKMGFAAGNVCEVIGLTYNFNASSNAMGASRMGIKLLQYPANEQFTART